MIDAIAKVSMGILFIAATPVDAAVPELWANWGLAGVVVAYVLWRDWQREKRMGAAIDTQQKWIRETLVETLEHNAAAMERMATWLEDDIRRGPTKRLRTVESHHDDHG
jgi:hypothetical protein